MLIAFRMKVLPMKGGPEISRPITRDSTPRSERALARVSTINARSFTNSTLIESRDLTLLGARVGTFAGCRSPRRNDQTRHYFHVLVLISFGGNSRGFSEPRFRVG